MYRLLIASVVCVSAICSAETREGVTRTSPLTTFSTHRSSDVFSQCVLDAVQKEFPVSRIDSKQTGKEILVSRSPTDDIVAIIDVQDRPGGGGAMVMMRTASPTQPQRDPIVKKARNCQ